MTRSWWRTLPGLPCRRPRSRSVLDFDGGHQGARRDSSLSQHAPAGEGTQVHGDLPPFHRPARAAGTGGLPHPASPLRLGRLSHCGLPVQNGPNEKTASSQNRRRTISTSPAARGVEWPGERPRELRRRPDWPGPGFGRRHAGLNLMVQPSSAILTNPHTICYMNSVVQSLAWTVKRSGHGLDYAYGCLARAFEKLLLPGRLCLLDELSWRPLIRSWPKTRGQQDAAEFLCHLLATSQPGAFRGTWQSRIQQGSSDSCRYQVVDQGGLHAPIILELHPGGLSYSIASWKSQFATHALQDASALLVLQLRRYSHRGGALSKDTVMCAIEAGELIYMPIFSEGLGLTYVKYRLASVVYHLGESPHSGHYKTALSVAQPATGGQMQWQFTIMDDGRPPSVANPQDILEVQCNSYICFFSICGQHE